MYNPHKKSLLKFPIARFPALHQLLYTFFCLYQVLAFPPIYGFISKSISGILWVPDSLLVEEASLEAVESNVAGELVLVFRPEYLAAIAFKQVEVRTKTDYLIFLSLKQ